MSLFLQQGQNNDKSAAIFGPFFSWRGFYKSPCEELTDRLRTKGWHVVTSSTRLSRIARLADMLLTAFLQRKHFNIAVIEVYSGPAFIWAESVAQALKLLGKPFVLTLHGGNLPAFSRKWPGRVTRLLSSAAAVTAPSEYLRNAMQRYRNDIILVPNSIDSVRYEYRNRSLIQPKIVWLRAFDSIYNPTMAIKVIATLLEKNKPIHLEMIGPDKGDGSFQQTKDLAEMLGVTKNVTFTPGIPKDQVPSFIGRHDIFLNTSNIDNSPVSVIEAMTSGLCIVSTNVGGIPYLLEDGKTALLVPPDSPQAMADAVLRIVDDQNLAASLSENARLKSRQFSWDRNIVLWEDLLMNLITTTPTTET